MKLVEIEYKQLLSENEYELIKRYMLENNIIPFEHENFYFDTKDFKIKEEKKALRIRKSYDKYEACLKQQREFDLMEDNINLSKDQVEKIFKEPELLSSYYILDEKLILLGSLKTKRYELPLKEGLICLDKSTYLNKVDYEIEFEAIDYDQKAAFISFLKMFDITFKENKISKIERFDELLKKISYNK